MSTFLREHLTPFRWALIGVFTLSQVLILAWLWDGMGGSLGRLNTGFEMAATLTDGHSLQHAADVRIDGVTVGRVREITLDEDHRSVVRFHIQDESVLPMREGMTILPRVKSLLDDVYLEITPGPADAAELEEHTVLPVTASVERVQLDEVLGDLDAEARADAEALLADLGEGFGGRASELNDLALALGPLGDHGRQLLTTLVETQADLERVIDDTAVLLEVLDERDEQLVSLIDDAGRLAAATAGQDQAIVRTVDELPATIERLQGSSGSIVALSDALEPVAEDLSAAAPDLNEVLEDLGPTATELDAALPDVDAVLTELPPLLDTLPDASDHLLDLLGPTPEVLSHLNPSVRYIAPYAPELSSMFATWSDVLSTRDDNGHFIRLVLPIAHAEVANEMPLKTVRRNAYPLPGTLGSLDEFHGEFPIVGPDPIPHRPDPSEDREPREDEPGNVVEEVLQRLQEAAQPVFDLRDGLDLGGPDGLPERPAGDGAGPDDGGTEGDDAEALQAALARSPVADPVSRAAWLSLATVLLALAAWSSAMEAYRLHLRQRRLVSWEARGWRRRGT